MNFWTKLRPFSSPQALDGDDKDTSAWLQLRSEGAYFPVRERTTLVNASVQERERHSYLEQLEEEGFLTQLVDQWLLTWDEMFRLLGDSAHADSLALLALPPVGTLRPILSSSGSLFDADFQVQIAGWCRADRIPVRNVARTGAAVEVDGAPELLDANIWGVLNAVNELRRIQLDAPGEAGNQLGWAKIRKLAKRADVLLDGFLERTVVLRPETLKLHLERRMVGVDPVLEVTPQFEGEPEGWLASFERLQHIPDKYVIPTANGGVTHVLISPEVQTVLAEIRSMPGRRVAGEQASLFLKNPYAFLGDDAVNVLDPAEYDQALDDAGVFFYTFDLQPRLAADGSIIEVDVVLNAPKENEEAVVVVLADPLVLKEFVKEVGAKLYASLPCAFWRGHELDITPVTQGDVESWSALQGEWLRQASASTMNSLFDLSQYGERVIGIGVAEAISSPFLQKSAPEQWVPADVLSELGMDGELLGKWETANREHFEQFVCNIEQARKTGADKAVLPGPDMALPIKMAEQVATIWGDKFKESTPGVPKDDQERHTLLVENNIDEVGFGASRADAILEGRDATVALPAALLPTTKLREHQLQGVAWLQHLFKLSPTSTSGCILADDMGLGKTVQLLTFISWCIEQDPDGPPILIVAPVSLLDNWEREMHTFLDKSVATDVIKLYGREVTDAKMRKSDIPIEIRALGIKNLLNFGWRRGKRIVLTTYETLRDQEFSLARQEWSVVVCDEAQKIKNPAARVTQAARAVRARFRIACTGTPVENSLTDLWCLYDWVQPGLLGALNQFGRRFRKPIETRDEIGLVALAELRGLIEPQLLRRTKHDVAKDLPAKIEDQECKLLPMSGLQDRLYMSELIGFKQKSTLSEALGQQSAAILGLLHSLKMICAHPHSLRPEGELLAGSPKMAWTIAKLEAIKALGQKVIIFTELRDIQRALKDTIFERFGFAPMIINGDTNASAEKGNSRQGLIDQFQAAPGFGVIILSTTAVGFGVNVQKANHVIHFTRPWNPAKEDQATDRAYRIGQVNDVYVYYPTIVKAGLKTFEQTLDELLTKKRLMATDMLNGSGDIELSEFSTQL